MNLKELVKKVECGSRISQVKDLEFSFIKEEEQPRNKWVFDTPRFNDYTNELTKVLEEVCV